MLHDWPWGRNINLWSLGDIKIRNSAQEMRQKWRTNWNRGPRHERSFEGCRLLERCVSWRRAVQHLRKDTFV
jgi:hypothetical protein